MMAYVDPPLTGPGSQVPGPIDSSLQGSPLFHLEQEATPTSVERFTDTDPGICPTGNCPVEVYACYDPQDGLGDLDEAFGLWDPDTSLTLDSILDSQESPFLAFFRKLITAYETKYGMEELVKLGMIFEPGEGRDGYYEVKWHEPGDPYSIWYWETGEYVSNQPVEQYFGAGSIGAGFATVLSNGFRDRNELQFYQDVEFDLLSDADIQKAAEYLNQAISINEDFTDWMKFAGDAAELAITVLALTTGVGGVIAAGAWALRAAALLMLAADMADAGRVASKYLGANGGKGYNVLEEAAAYLGKNLDDDDGDKAARVAYHTFNTVVSLKGKWKLVALSVPGLAYGSALLQETEGEETEFWAQD